MTTIRWTHPSVVRLVDQGVTDDPFAWVEHRARELALTAMEEGWGGPPYDSFRLADALGIEVVARQDLEDARLVSVEGKPRIEFNPQRRPARTRFSVAHEIGHMLFDDYADRERYRDMDQRRDDDWQLEVLCNIAAAEFLMPAGSLPISEASDLDLVRLMSERARFQVSTEALLRRVVRLTSRPAALFAAARTGDGPAFRVDYTVASRSWRAPIGQGSEVRDTVLARCTAVGYADHAVESWDGNDLRVQAVGVPPYPGDRFPRVVGLLEPAGAAPADDAGIKYVRGDASDPRPDGPTLIAHVVNNKARRWGGRGFATALMNRYPTAADAYAEWNNGSRPLGAVHLHRVTDGLSVASMVAQVGYGPAPTGQRRLRLRALRQALENLAAHAVELGAGVHMPLIGTGQGGVHWPQVRDLVLEELAGKHIPVTVYVLPDAPMPEEASVEEQTALL